MADLTSASTGAGGLGTRSARWALTGAWALGVISDVLSGVLAPPFGIELLGVPLGLAGAIVLTRRGNAALPTRQAVVVAIAAVISALCALVSGAPLGHIWSFNFAAYLAALLLPRGNVRAGLASGVLILVSGLAWGVFLQAPAVDLVQLLALPVMGLIVGAVWRWLLGRIVLREVTYNREVERAAIAERIAEASDVAIRAELAEVRADVGGLLRSISAGDPLDDELVDRIAVAEADIRDRIRSPHLRHAALRAAIDRARRRGVQVLLLGSSSQAGAIAGPLVDSLVQALDAVESGTVTLRAIPPGRTGAISLMWAREETSERLLFASGGQLLSRH